MNDDSVTWNDVYSVGFEPIDNQHKELVKIINKLFEECKQGGPVAERAFLQTVKEAADYSREHFSNEDNYMAQAGFPKLFEHRKQHDEFLNAVLKSMHEFKAGKSNPIELARFLKNWLLTHIAESDKQYAPYLAKL